MDDLIYKIIEANQTDAGVKPYPPKPQYERGGFLFTCPFCNETVNSHHFLNARSYEDACVRHLEEKHSSELSQEKIEDNIDKGSDILMAEHEKTHSEP